MLRKISFILCASVFALGGTAGFSETSFALEKLIKGAPAHVSPLPNARIHRQSAGALTVYDVQIDQTGSDAVEAREKAMAEAKRLAFKQLVERNKAGNIPVPDDRTLGMLVQDFEIQEEKLSPTRYVAMFTVRFRDLVRDYVYVDMARDYPSAFAKPDAEEFKTDAEKKAEEEKKLQASNDDGTLSEENAEQAKTVENATQDALEKSVAESRLKKPLEQGFFDKRTLVLPYLERADKTTILWEANNYWREMWQREGNETKAGQYIFVVPLGDVTDVSMGSEHAVWSGDYRTIEKLQMKYNADTVLLAIGKKDQDRFDVDLYFYDHGVLQRRQTIQSFTGHQADTIVYRQGVDTVRQYVENLRVDPATHRQVDMGPNTVEEISKSLAGMTGRTSMPGQASGSGMAPPTGLQNADGMRTNEEGTVTTDMSQLSTSPSHATTPIDRSSPLSVAARTDINAQMSFSQYATWMDFQRRMSSMMPLIKIQIQSLSKNGARFKIQSNAHMDVVRDELKRNGVIMSLPSAEVQSSMMSTMGATSAPIYDVRLLN